jgi:hypothetical protein
VFVLNVYPTSIGGLDLSRDGNTIYYPDEVNIADHHWRDSIK